MKTLAFLSISVIAFAGNTPSLPPGDVDTLHTKNRVEPLLTTAPLPLSAGRSLLLEPGVLATSALDALTLSTHGNSRMELVFGNERVALTSPITARVTEAGLDFGSGKVYSAASFTLRRSPQETDENLQKMRDAAAALKAKVVANTKTQDDIKAFLTAYFRVYPNSPFATSLNFDQATIEQLTHLSPIGY